VTRFCVRIHHAGYSYPRLRNVWRTADRLGYDGASLYDVLAPRAFEVWTALSVLATATRRLTAIPLVLDISYRHPALLAKMAATLDHLTGGNRLILGLGYGGNPADHLTYGFDWPSSVSTRVTRLEQDVVRIRSLWADPEHGFPPRTQGGPPILIASRGRQYGLAGVGRHADLCNVSFDLSPSEWREYQRVLAEHCRRAGRNPRDVGLTQNGVSRFLRVREISLANRPATGSKVRSSGPPKRSWNASDPTQTQVSRWPGCSCCFQICHQLARCVYLLNKYSPYTGECMPTLPFEIDPARTALLVIDMQNGFGAPEGTLGKAGFDISMTRGMIPHIQSLLDAARAVGMHVFWSRQVHYPDDRTRDQRLIPGHLARGAGRSMLCARNTWDAELIDELAPYVRPEDDVIEKHRASCFYSSTFEAKLRIHGIQMLIVTGTTASFCVDSTIREAYARDFDVLVPADAISDTEIEATRAVLRSTERFHGFVTTTEDVLAALARLRSAAAAVAKNDVSKPTAMN
jgi:ureidoacrylate peracid hydrolase